MTRTCILHIGLAKTGSTSIQHAMHGYDDGRIAYAPFRDPNHSSPLFVLFCGDPSRLDTQALNWRTARQHARFVNRSRTAFQDAMDSGRDLILSGEGFGGKLTPDEVGLLAETLGQHFDRVRVIAYLRPYQSLCPSAWQQNVKWGERRFKVPVPKLRRKLQPFIDHFGRDAVEACLFDRTALRNGDIVDDFAARVGIDAAALPRPKRNETMSLEAMAILFAHNVFDLQAPARSERRQQRKELILDLQGFGNGRFGYHPGIMAEACAEHAADLDWASDLVGADLVGQWQPVERPIKDEGQLLAIAAAEMKAAQAHLDERRASRPPAPVPSPSGPASFRLVPVIRRSLRRQSRRLRSLLRQPDPR